MHRLSLSRLNRIRLTRLFQECPRVDIAVDCALEDQMGRAYVDDIDHPRFAMIQSGPFCYFAGDPTLESARKTLQRFPDHTLFMPSAAGWKEAFLAIHQSAATCLERYSYTSAHLLAEPLERLLAISPHRWGLRRIDRELAERMFEDGNLLADLSEFESGTDFHERGIGWYLADGEMITGGAYSSLVGNHALEVSVFVRPEFRRRGIATALSARLLLDCRAAGIEPHWDAANLPSRGLAEKLGYRLTGTYTSYCLDS